MVKRQDYYEEEEKEDYFDENELINRVNTFFKDENKNFCIRPSAVVIKSTDYSAEIEFTDIADQVVIYNKYLTDESIFENDNVGYEGIFVCADTSIYQFFDDIEYGYLEDNLWYDITVGDTTDEQSRLSGDVLDNFIDSKQNIKDYTKSEIEKYRDISKNNKDKFYILLAKPSISLYSKHYWDSEKSSKDSDLLEINTGINTYVMDKSIYENTYKDKLIEAYRSKYFVLRGGATIETESGDGVDYTLNENVKTISLKTGEEMTSLQDIFYEDSEYMNVIENQIKTELRKLNADESKFDEYIKNSEYKLKDFAVCVSIPDLPDFELQIEYNSFGESMFKHWL